MFAEHEKMYKSDADYYDYLRKLRYPKGFVCSKYGKKDAWTTDRDLLLCQIVISHHPAKPYFFSPVPPTLMPRIFLSLDAIDQILWHTLAHKHENIRDFL